jgi:hypothetical protein
MALSIWAGARKKETIPVGRLFVLSHPPLCLPTCLICLSPRFAFVAGYRCRCCRASAEKTGCEEKKMTAGEIYSRPPLCFGRGGTELGSG